MNNTVIAGGTNPLVTSRVVALASASVFDAVNGIAGRYADSIWDWRSTGGFSPPPPLVGALGIVGSPSAIGV